MSISPIGPVDAKIVLVGEFPHEQDLIKGEPFCGSPGMELSRILREAGTSREQCYIIMVYPDRVRGSRVEGLIPQRKMDIAAHHILYNGKFVEPALIPYIEALKGSLEAVKPNVVCAIGNLALWVLTGEWGVGNWRSSIMESTLIPGLKVIPTLSPAILNTQWDQRPLIAHDLKRVVRESARSGIHRPEYKFIIRPTYEQALATLDRLLLKAEEAFKGGVKLKLGVDIETRSGHTACIALAWSTVDALCIPLMCVTDREGYWSTEQEATICLLICNLLRKVKVIGQNWNYDEQYNYRHWHFLCPDVEDTMIMQHSCFSTLPKNLAFLSSMYLDDHLYWKDDLTNWAEGPTGEGEDTYWRYNCTDAVRTLAIHPVLENIVRSTDMIEVNAFQQKLRPVVLKTMIKGVRMDTTARDALSKALQKEAKDREDWLFEVLGEEVNIKSPKQMAELFYSTLNQKEIRKRNTVGGLSPTTDEEAMRKIAEREPLLEPLCRKITELRSIGVFHSTFVQAALDIDGRIRTSFNICGTSTYRFASSKNAFGSGLNCQNIPKGGETTEGGLLLPNVRNLFIPDHGHTMFDIDLDSADLRIVTWESDCAWMKDHFRNGRKPYIEVMREYYHNQSMTKKSHPREYAMFKSLCHGTNYLGTADGIAPRIGLNVHETERIQKWYFGLAPEIKAWQDDIKKQVAGRRYVENIFGYRNYFFSKLEGTIFNEAVAWIPQSSVACLINRGYVNIQENLKEVEVLLQVHDSLVGQFDSIHGDWALRRIVEECEVPLPYDDPLIIPVGVVSSKASWGECE